jgi:hypothetical protein
MGETTKEDKKERNLTMNSKGVLSKEVKSENVNRRRIEDENEIDLIVSQTNSMYKLRMKVSPAVLT